MLDNQTLVIILDKPFLVDTTKAKILVVKRARKCACTNGVFNHNRYRDACMDHTTQVFNSRLLGQTLLESLDSTTRNRIQQCADLESPSLGFPLSNDGLWVLAWIINRITPSLAYFQTGVRTMCAAIQLDPSVPPHGRKTYEYRTFLDACHRIYPYLEDPRDIIEKIIHAFRPSGDQRILTFIHAWSATYACNPKALHVSDVISILNDVLNTIENEEQEALLHAPTPAPAVATSPQVLAMTAPTTMQDLLATMQAALAGNGHTQNNPNNRSGNNQKPRRLSPTWMRDSPPPTELLTTRAWVNPDTRAKHDFKWCQHCELWTTALPGHQKDHFTGHPDDLDQYRNKPTKKSSHDSGKRPNTNNYNNNSRSNSGKRHDNGRRHDHRNPGRSSNNIDNRRSTRFANAAVITDDMKAALLADPDFCARLANLAKAAPK